MSATRSFSSNLRILRLVGPALGLLTAGAWVVAQGTLPSAVGSQANTDASAQRRLQETMQETQRQRRIEEQIHRLAPALEATALSGSRGPVLTRKALAALARLRAEGISPKDALDRAARSARLDSAASEKPSAYLRNLFLQNSDAITPAVLTQLEAGEDPSPALSLPPYQP